MSELQVGQTVLKEILEQEQAKEEAAAIAKQREKAVAEAAVAKVLHPINPNIAVLKTLSTR